MIVMNFKGQSLVVLLVQTAFAFVTRKSSKKTLWRYRIEMIISRGFIRKLDSLGWLKE